MRSFIKYGLYYVLGLIAINLILYHMFFKPVLYERYLGSLELLKDEKHIPVMLLGDSHANAIPAEMLPVTTFRRFCYPSDSYFDIYNKISYCIKEGIQIDKILLIADDHVVSEYRTRANNTETSILLSSYRSYRNLLNYSLPKYFYVRYLKRYLPMLESSNSMLLYNFIESYTRVRKYHYDEKTWEEYTYSEKHRSIKSRIRSQYAPAAHSLLACTDSIISLCKQNRIPITGIVYPLSADYRKQVDQLNYPSVPERFNAHGIPVINFRNYFIDDAYFYDQDHVNDKGAKILADSIIRYINYNGI